MMPKSPDNQVVIMSLGCKCNVLNFVVLIVEKFNSGCRLKHFVLFGQRLTKMRLISNLRLGFAKDLLNCRVTFYVIWWDKLCSSSWK